MHSVLFSFGAEDFILRHVLFVSRVLLRLEVCGSQSKLSPYYAKKADARKHSRQ